ncbi:MAG TPA: preprotein translocase subunit SecG [Gammaproteobacteria bacterium]|nr:preprotein translocase subunit SecG [Gammaproteobacteria bacterium]
MHQVLLIIQILVAIALIGLILLQQGRGADAGAAFGSGSSGSIFGSRGPASFLAKLTALLAALFFFNSVGLAVITTQTVERQSVVERYQDEVPDAGTDAGDSEPTGTSDVPTGMGGEGSGAVSDVPSAPEPSGGEQQN